MPAERRRGTWTIPLVLAALTVFGLLAALLGSAAWRLPACAALAVPVVATLRRGRPVRPR